MPPPTRGAVKPAALEARRRRRRLSRRHGRRVVAAVACVVASSPPGPSQSQSRHRRRRRRCCVVAAAGAAIPSEVFQFKVQTSMCSVVTRAVSVQLESVRKCLHLPSVCLRLCKLHPVSNSYVSLNRDRLYKVVCTVKCRFKAVLYDSIVCTKYVQDLL